MLWSICLSAMLCHTFCSSSKPPQMTNMQTQACKRTSPEELCVSNWMRLRFGTRSYVCHERGMQLQHHPYVKWSTNCGAWTLDGGHKRWFRRMHAWRMHGRQ
uniref:Putative secreted protein n=1 Tax=Anopheles marajoara TaxID=58244 RepID=A0A2M4C8P0_9DIPT